MILLFSGKKATKVKKKIAIATVNQNDLINKFITNIRNRY